jgi:predicted dehydrogenase/acetyltransferase-like isoleucine patch superfamily enzyme
MRTSRAARRATPRVAVIGCGYWGRNLVRTFHELGALSAICDVELERGRELSTHYRVPALSLEEIVAAGEIEAAVLATPAETHARLALRLLNAGKHVFVEKPLALSIKDAVAVREAAAANDRLIMVGHLLRYHPAFLKLSELIAGGELGRLNYIYSNRLNLGKFRREEDVFWSFAPHDISMILALAGEDPESVEAVGHGYLRNNIADVTTTHLRFASGINAHVFVSWLHPYKEQRLVVVGDAGMAVFNDGEPWSDKLVFYRHRVAWRDGAPEAARADGKPIAVERAEPLLLECAHFLDSMRGGQSPWTDAQEGIRVLCVLDAARTSMDHGRAIRLTAAKASVSAMPYFAHESAYIDDKCEIGAGTKIWHFSHILTGSTVGQNCVIGQNVVIGPDVSIGDRCKIQNNVSVYKGVVLEDGVFCGPSCVFTNVNNPRAEIDRREEFRTTIVGRGATIGANATIVCGHRLGPHCFVAAGAVVTRDVRGHAIVAGNPARQIGWVSHAGERLGDDLVCPRMGTRYTLDAEGELREIVDVRRIA